MKMLEMECPGCEAVLELDAGFAGGVCRCSQCGTLMTVPAGDGEDHQGQSATRSRPERPATPHATSTTHANAPQNAEMAHGEPARRKSASPPLPPGTDMRATRAPSQAESTSAQSRTRRFARALAVVTGAAITVAGAVWAIAMWGA